MDYALAGENPCEVDPNLLFDPRELDRLRRGGVPIPIDDRDDVDPLYFIDDDFMDFLAAEGDRIEHNGGLLLDRGVQEAPDGFNLPD